MFEDFSYTASADAITSPSCVKTKLLRPWCLQRNKRSGLFVIFERIMSKYQIDFHRDSKTDQVPQSHMYLTEYWGDKQINRQKLEYILVQVLDVNNAEIQFLWSEWD